MNGRNLLGAMLVAVAVPLGAVSQDVPQPNEQMQAVLDKLAELGAQPLGTADLETARNQPAPADAAMAVMEEQGIEPEAALAAIATEDIAIPGPAGDIPARVYTPAGAAPFPVIVYYHGGGWVIGDLDTYDGSARALADGAGAIVVSTHYRQGPENPFPAAHEDAYAAYAWVVENVHRHNGDARRLAVAGESAGGNLAINVAIEARNRLARVPGHMLLVHPIAGGDDMTTESYDVHANARPLSRQAMEWFFEHALESPEQAVDPRIDLIDRPDLAGLPPATVVTADIDPLRTEGQMLAVLLDLAGVKVEAQNYVGVTHAFFGMGAVVEEAQLAVDFATERLRESFETN